MRNGPDAPWYRDPRIISTRPLEFFPARGMSAAERLNGMTRFVLYASIGLAAYRNDWAPLGWGLLVIVILSLVTQIPVPKKAVAYCETSDPVSKSACCTRPVPDNPFMNVLTNEYAASKPAACATTTQTLQQSQAYFDVNLPREISDVYRNRASDRQFVTMPATGNNGTPDTLAFRNYLFSQLVKGPKCK